MKLSCGIVRDLLPLYAEQMTGEETNAAVREHLEGCPACSQALKELEKTTPAPTEDVQAMQKLKKGLRVRRWRAAALAALAVFLPLYALFARSVVKEYLPYSEGLVTVEGVRLNEDQEEALYLSYDSRVNGLRYEMTEDADTGERTLFIMGYDYASTELMIVQDLETGEQTLRIATVHETAPDQRHESMVSPVPDRVIYGFSGDQVLLYGEPMKGGMEILPRLVLGYYLMIALALAVVLGVPALFLRRKTVGPILRQLFLAPVAYILGHLLIKGFVTVSFDATWELLQILIAAAAFYGLLSLGWQALRQWKLDRE